MLLFKSFTILIIGFVLLIKGADFFAVSYTHLTLPTN